MAGSGAAEGVSVWVSLAVNEEELMDGEKEDLVEEKSPSMKER